MTFIQKKSPVSVNRFSAETNTGKWNAYVAEKFDMGIVYRVLPILSIGPSSIFDVQRTQYA